MAIDLQKINVKFYLTADAVLSAEDAFRIFSQWIPETTDEVLIDVADYQHVSEGPKTVLVGHEANYILDNSGGRYGLLYGQKAVAEGSNQERLRTVLAAALKACRRLEETEDATAKAEFGCDEVVIVINDRLAVSNTDAALEELRGDLEPVLKQLYGGAAIQLTREGDERHRLAVRVRAEGNFGAEALLSNLNN